jgi:hypothetical protein
MCIRMVGRPLSRQQGVSQAFHSEQRPASLRTHSFILLSFLGIIVCGCGGITQQSTNTIVATPSTIAFGSVAVGQTATASIILQNRGVAAVKVEDIGASGQVFSIVGGATFPMTLPAGASVTLKLQFTPTASGSMSEPLMITSSIAPNPSAIANVNGTGTPGLSALTCNSNALSGAGTDSCSLNLNTAAPTGGFVVNLSSNNAALALPSTVTVPPNATSAGFTATATAVSAQQSVTLTATGSGTSETFAINLQPNTGAPKKVALSWNAPASTDDPITGYIVFRSTSGSSAYQMLSTSTDPDTTYTDSSVQGGTTYEYYVESIDAAGTKSAPSNMTTIAVP